jgi:glycosyltransferase involved in cell wall biosynthesis
VEVNSDGVHWLGDVPDDELARLYRGARCFAYASLYEGFGIPVLEAMACGTPVVTSRGSGTEEVADGAAILVDPLDPMDIATGIERAVSKRDELVRRGRERARAFTWRAAAEATVAVYNEAAA